MPRTSSPGRPMLATKGDRVPESDGWVHEVKWDGVRALVDCRAGAGGVWTRTERDVSVAFPEVAALATSYDDLLVDGEIVRLGRGRPTLAGLADRIHLTDPRRAERLAQTDPVTLLVFDVLRADGADLAGAPWHERRAVLEGLGLDDVSWQVPATYDDGPALHAAAREQGLEGIVSKKRDARYRWATRSRDWLKFPIRPTASFVVGGWRGETDSPQRLGAVLVGEPTPDGLVYRGKVGSGLAGKAGRALLERLSASDESPFVDEVPRLDARGTHWVEPRVVVDVEHLMLSDAGRLRQPSYRGVRDLGPEDL
ncbi:hypothetical protein GCM10011519_33330 [Marmoricola endophyticus]|uniref:DNA ligase (ATP) n=1 Tax=Marmoricola endophyticus TaxID=2040280 RepID=A0A917BS74_9ACTN|nr:DNA ligase [Marmoricola endophyticus]GGF56755.1 hypothetical protein GCM10011519_33330 [Marmoricola endophyticus]